MLRFYWLFLICFVLLVLEFLLSTWSVIFPTAIFAAFYIGLAFGPRRGMLCGAMVGVVSEVMFARQITVLPLLLPFVFFLIVFRKFGNRHSVINHAVAGLGLSSTYAAYFLVLENIHFLHGWSLLSGPSAVWLFVLGGLPGLFIFPGLIWLFDTLAEKMQIERFTVQTAGVR